MSDLQKLLRKFLNESDKITPDECRRMLEDLGYRERKRPGSERVFHKKGCCPINVPTPKKGKYIKSPYIKRIIRLLELEDRLESD